MSRSSYGNSGEMLVKRNKAPPKPKYIQRNGKRIDPLHEKIDSAKFTKDIEIYANHHKLPEWAGNRLSEHIIHEVSRRDNDLKYSPTPKNLANPMKWKQVWHHNHIHRGDIAFPGSSHDSPKSPKKKGIKSLLAKIKGNKQSSKMIDEESSGKDDEFGIGEQMQKGKLVDIAKINAFSTDDLVDDIIYDVEIKDPMELKEMIDCAASHTVNPWLPLKDLMGRNHLFSLQIVRENTIRSIALCSPKPGDQIPGAVTLACDRNKQIHLSTTISVIIYDANKGILSKQTLPLKNYLLKN